MSITIKETDKIICIIGLPATGKTTLSDVISIDRPHKVFHTDDYIVDRRFNALDIAHHLRYNLENDRYIIEGVGCYLLLRDNIVKPDLIIECLASEGVRQERYNLERGLKDFKAFDCTYRRMFEDYKKKNKDRLPAIQQYLSHTL